MPYHNAGELIALLKKEHLEVNRDMGQNFLVNENVVKKIIRAADLRKEDFVVEVGPGLGILTRALAGAAARVRVIEIDRNIIPILRKETSEFKNVFIEWGNALKADLPSEPYKLVANIPYYITSPLLNYFLNPPKPDWQRPSLIVLMVQKEVAEKICAGPGEHSILSLNVQNFGRPSIVTKVPKTDFYPPPKVDSAVIKIETYASPLIKNFKLFKQLTSICFNQKRKTILNTMQNFPLPGKMDKNAMKTRALAILEKAGIDPSARPQTFTVENWQKLIEIIQTIS